VTTRAAPWNHRTPRAMRPGCGFAAVRRGC